MAFGGKKKADPAVEQVLDVAKSKTGIMTIPGIKIDSFRTLLIGTAPLVCHKFSEKARNMMKSKQMGIAQGAREAKNPEEVFHGARYRLFDGTDGIPAGGLKACFVAGARGEVTTTMTAGKGAISVKPDDPVENLIRILTSDPSEGYVEPTMREDICRNATGVADIRFRPMYWPWALFVDVETIPSLISTNQALQMIAHAGRAEGLCEWRPGSPKSKSGLWGTFRLASEAEVEAFENDQLFKMLRASIPGASDFGSDAEGGHMDRFKVAAE